MKTALTQSTASSQSFCALGSALLSGCCILGNYYARNCSTNAKLLSAPRAFLRNTFIGLWIPSHRGAHTASPLSSSGRLPRGRRSATSDVQRAFSSHFIREAHKSFTTVVVLGGKKEMKEGHIFAFLFFFLQHTLQNQRADARLIGKDVKIPLIDGVAAKPEKFKGDARFGGQD